EGISVIDYLDVYRRFCMVQRESYKLNTIAEIELSESKVDYGDTNLSSLADDNWELFVDYNIQDVKLLVKLEDKLRYLELLRMLAYTGLTTFEAAMGSLSVITGSTAIRARYRQQRIPTFIRNDLDKGKNPGAYVSEPQQGFQEHIVSFDANSLYPNTMISLNLSPETKMGKIEETNNDDGTIIFRHVNGNAYNLTKEKFNKFVEKENLAVSKSNVLFSQAKKGIIPEIVDRYYSQRVEIKNELKKLKKKLSTLTKGTDDYKTTKLEIDRLNIKQHTIKIFINTIYGYFGNKHAPIGDDDLASSITLTGQAVIKQCNELARLFIREKIGSDTDADPVIYNDTDSVYITLKDIVNKNKSDDLAIVHVSQARRSRRTGQVLRGSLLGLCNTLGFHEMLGWMSSLVIRCDIFKKFMPVALDHYPESAYGQSAAFLELAHDKGALFVDMDWVETQDQRQTQESIQRWAEVNMGER
ncbi:MAG: hypothetical protein EB127_26640, partial [Alphaproteobacteria bacterium]|nr:hypothetical protein [Alphaproteobacteria bacterium]